MHRSRTLFTSVLVALVTSLLLIPTATAVPLADGFYKPGYTNTIYRVVNYSWGSYPWTVSESEWNLAGRPVPASTPTDYVKYPWSPTSYAVTFWPGSEVNWQWDRLNEAQWAQAGHPPIRNAGFIDGSDLYKWDTSNELFIQGEDSTVHKLSYGEWASTNFRAPNYRTGTGYVKLSWAPEIAYVYELTTGAGYQIDATEWASKAYPTPLITQRITGDSFFKFSFSPTIYYDGPTMYRAISSREWAAAGYPAPTRY